MYNYNVLPAELRAERSSKLSKLDVRCLSYWRNTFCNKTAKKHSQET